MDVSRVNFYGTNDLTIFEDIERAKKVLHNFDTKEDYINNIIDVVELYKVLKMLQQIPSQLGVEDSEQKRLEKTMKASLYAFFNQMSETHIENCFEYFFSKENTSKKKCEITDEVLSTTTFTNYKKGFIQCFNDFKLFNRISEKAFEVLVNKFNVPLQYLLKHQEMCLFYESLFRKMFLNDSRNVEIILAMQENNTHDAYYVPKTIKNTELEEMFFNYLELEIYNVNFIETIETIGQIKIYKWPKDFQISPKLKMRAKRKHEELDRELFDKEKIEWNSISISIYNNKVQYDNASEPLKVLVNRDVFKKRLDPIHILEYIMYRPEYFTDNFLIAQCSFPNKDIGQIEKIIRKPKLNNEFFKYTMKDIRQRQMWLIIAMAQHQLEDNQGVRIEDLIKYFFDDYLNNMFEIEWLPNYFAGKEDPYNVQIYALSNLEERLRKEWMILVNEKNIDPDLFIQEVTPKIRNVPSLLKEKYSYLNNDNVLYSALERLFGESNDIEVFTLNIDDENFYKLLVSTRLSLDGTSSYCSSSLVYLKDRNLISIDAGENYSFTDKQAMRLVILRRIYAYGCIDNYAGVGLIRSKDWMDQYMSEIHEMANEGILRTENTLYAEPETEFMSYMLDNTMFNNAKAMRNKYSHGSEINEDEFQEDYYSYLAIILIFSMKIREELVIYSEEKPDQTESDK